MQRDEFNAVIDQQQGLISQIRDMAHEVHASVNQYYDETLPYSVHLDSVVGQIQEYAYLICEKPEEVIPIIFGGYFHDSIEDARLTYNNVLRIANSLMDEKQALLATEIVYALTNEKGRTRAERADDRYYTGIRTTPYAPLCKFADRLANLSYSVNHGSNKHNKDMKVVYTNEMPHFIAELTKGDSNDPRLSVPAEMIAAAEKLLK